MTALHLATADDIDRLLPMIAAYHAEADIEQTNDARRAALMPLLEGSPHGVAYLIGPMRAPVGYIVISFGWSIEFGGMDGFVDEVFIRPNVRRRGLGTEVLLSLPKALASAGLKALHLEVSHQNPRARALYEKLHFKPRDTHMLMTRRL